MVLQDRLRRALHQPESLVIIAGYSFGDQHLNELLLEAASMRQRSEFVAFCYSTIPDALATPAMSIPNFQVLGDRESILEGIRANWIPPIGLRRTYGKTTNSFWAISSGSNGRAKWRSVIPPVWGGFDTYSEQQLLSLSIPISRAWHRSSGAICNPLGRLDRSF